MKKMLKLIAGAALFGVLASAVFQGSNYLADLYGVGEENTTDVEQKATIQTAGITQTNATQETAKADVSDVAESVLPSIVAIDVKVVYQQRDFFGRIHQNEAQGSGSGIIIEEDDAAIYLATNNHVVEGSAEVIITFCDESTAAATVIGTDENSDLAVVKVAKSSLTEQTLSNIKVAKLADSNEIRVGQQAIAIGNALGYGTSVTVGYVSAKDRQIDISTEEPQNDQQEVSEQELMKLIQTDAAINPGNSGGALVDSEGKVIGINSSKFASEEVEGMGFAIPISDAVPIIERIMNQGENKESSKENV